MLLRYLVDVLISDPFLALYRLEYQDTAATMQKVELIEMFSKAVIQLCNHMGVPLGVDILRNTQPPVVASVLLSSPISGGYVQVGHIPEGPSGEEVVLHKTNQALHLAFCKRIPGLAESGLESHSPHKLLVVLLPDGMAVLAMLDNNAFSCCRSRRTEGRPYTGKHGLCQ